MDRAGSSIRREELVVGETEQLLPEERIPNFLERGLR